MAAGLIDEYLLLIHPLVFGTGRRLFPEGVHASLRLTDSVVTTKGVVIATYEPLKVVRELCDEGCRTVSSRRRRAAERRQRVRGPRRGGRRRREASAASGEL